VRGFRSMRVGMTLAASGVWGVHAGVCKRPAGDRHIMGRGQTFWLKQELSLIHI